MEKIKLLFEGFKTGFKEFGYFISNILNSIMLLITFIFGIGLVSIYNKIKKKKFLKMNFNNEKSYWQDKKNRNKTLEDSLKPF